MHDIVGEVKNMILEVLKIGPVHVEERWELSATSLISN